MLHRSERVARLVQECECTLTKVPPTKRHQHKKKSQAHSRNKNNTEANTLLLSSRSTCGGIGALLWHTIRLFSHSWQRAGTLLLEMRPACREGYASTPRRGLYSQGTGAYRALPLYQSLGRFQLWANALGICRGHRWGRLLWLVLLLWRRYELQHQCERVEMLLGWFSLHIQQYFRWYAGDIRVCCWGHVLIRIGDRKLHYYSSPALSPSKYPLARGLPQIWCTPL